MKRFTLKLAIAFGISYGIMMVVVVFAYTRVSNNFILQEAMHNLQNASETVSSRIHSQLDFDYHVFQTTIDTLELEGEQPLDYLQANPTTIALGEQSYLGFAEIDGRDLITPTETYTYHFDFEDQDFMQDVAIYSFDQAFKTGSEDAYVFFIYNDIIAYFDAQTYLAPLFDYIDLEHAYYIMNSTGSVLFQTPSIDKQIFFFDYLRDANETQVEIDRILDLVNDREIVSKQADFIQTPSIYVFNPLVTNLSTQNIYLVNIFAYDDVMDSMTYITNILWAFFVVIFLLFSGSMIVLYRMLEKKMTDIENAKIAHYYAKPFIVRINQKGKIKSYNRSFKHFLGDFDVYDTIMDFKYKEGIDVDKLLELIHKQSGLTAIFDLGLSQLVYVHFMTLRTTGGYLLIGDDVTQIEGKFDEFRNLALFNKVTQLPNLNSLKNDLNQLFDDKEALEKKNSIVTFDIVSFSNINLVLGEKSGDRFLLIIAELTRQSLEGYPATLYNPEKDVFVILFKDIENYNWVGRWTSKIAQVFEKPITIDRNLINIQINTGIFHIERDRYEILNAEVCYENVMLALNYAKQSSQRREFVYDVSLGLNASREQRMELDLANAIKNQEFKMALQPQYDNSNGRIIGFEALIRWNNPKYASESPLKFIQMAEKNNMIIDIGRIALHETFQIAKDLEKYNVHISVNVSPVQMLQAGFVNEIISIFEQYELKKGSISLEITETFLIGSFDLVITKLKLLQKYGFDIHLDDFGTGYSSLQYLRDLPINTIKIDRAFIINLETDAHSRAIVSMISSLAKNIGYHVVAEGIENLKQNQIAFKAGCNIIQGYLVSAPVYYEDAVNLIHAYNIDKTKTVSLQKPKEKGAKK